MTSGRFWMIAATLASTTAALAAGCGDNGSPCSTCPSMEGRYALEFAEGAIPADCASLGVTLPQGPLDIQRAGAGLTATLEGVELQGTVYQTFDFSLLGTQAALDGGSTQYSVSGRYTPARTDGGTGGISGSFTGTYARGSAQGTRRCSILRAYTAAQQRQP
ncbi:hypothetical protein [Hyalangium sp.]|uniref:hypothetical protein n=1 Tax=Hyalangium sp. TaxID=2028555 RepID=UPI002D37988B|nr:hypothetical protein [Hyalangium sp.]HYI00790.1 hypothetical protein [Hyalangium sp.]